MRASQVRCAAAGDMPPAPRAAVHPTTHIRLHHNPGAHPAALPELLPALPLADPQRPLDATAYRPPPPNCTLAEPWRLCLAPSAYTGSDSDSEDDEEGGGRAAEAAALAGKGPKVRQACSAPAAPPAITAPPVMAGRTQGIVSPITHSKQQRGKG